MVELLITGGIIAAAVMMMSTRRPAPAAFNSRFETSNDLPCPWCHAATSENDDRCPGCGQVFG